MSAPMINMLMGNVCKICRLCSKIPRQKYIHRLKHMGHFSLIESDTKAMDEMIAKGYKYKKHPGQVTLKTVMIPEDLQKAIDLIIEKYPVKNLREEAKTLYRYLQTRCEPVEKSAFNAKLLEIEEDLQKKSKVNIEELNEEQRNKYETEMKRKIIKRLKQVIYHWQPLKYNAPKAIHYLVARMTADYSLALHCLNEIRIRDPDFNPRTIFDFGSGVGSTIWAANTVWGKSVLEYYCVDESAEMNTLARLLLQGGEEHRDMSIQGVHFRQFIPSTSQNKFDVVVSCNTLMEFSSKDERLENILTLWNMTEKYLVLIEKGGNSGFRLINEARDLLLQKNSHENEPQEGHVFSPCPHDLPCPKLIQRESPCFFESKYMPLKQYEKSVAAQKEWFSYLVFKREPREEGIIWPRIIQEVNKPSRHTHCHLCCSDGKLRHFVLSAAKHGKDLYKCSRYSQWGDRLPAIVKTDEEETSDNVENRSLKVS